MSLRFSANLSFMFCEETSFIKRFALAKQAGFSAVEAAIPYDIPKEELAKELKAQGQEQVLVNTYGGNSFGFAAMTVKSTEYMESLERSIEYCKALNCKKLHILSGKSSPDHPGSEETLFENLQKSIPILQANDIIGLIEPINSYSLPGYFMNNFDIAVRIIEKLNSPFLRLQLDIFHLQFLKGDLTNSIKNLVPITGHIQIAQVPDRHEPDSQGEINYDHVFKTIQETNYDGWIGLEYKPKTSTVEGLGWMKKYSN